MKKYKRPLSENKEFLQELKDLDNFMDKVFRRRYKKEILYFIDFDCNNNY